MAILNPIPLFEFAATALASLAGLKGLYDAIRDLLAKGRARDVVFRKAMEDPKFKELVLKFNDAKEDEEADLQHVVEEISRELSKLAPEDRRRVLEGLNQTSKSAERRYVESITK